MNKVKFGIIGMGNQGSHYANLLKDGKVDNGVLCAMCDNKPSKLQYAKDKYGDLENTYFFSDYIEMLNANICDAILVETDVWNLTEIAKKCVLAGKHIHLDKPASANL
jgi:predicted dehydrogenase